MIGSDDRAVPKAPQLVGGGSRALVDFIVIGAMRAGTTTLNAALSRHPEISMARNKETDFFIAEKNLSRGTGWYRAQFDQSRAILGEASPNYAKAADFGGVPARVARHVPTVRLIYLVRDPVARAVSQFGHSWSMGRLRTLPKDLPDSHEYGRLIDISSYARQLDLWRAHFADEQLLIVDFDAMLADPVPQMDRILAHIGASPMPIDALGNQNRGGDLSRVPLPLLRLSRGRLRPILTRLLGPEARDRLRAWSAIGPRRTPPPFPETVLERMRADLVDDAHRFRQMTGWELPHWSV